MFQKIENRLSVHMNGDVDLTKAANLEFYVKQACHTFEYTPEVVDETHCTVLIPYEDAMKLRPGDVWLQMAFTDENGNKLTVRKVQQPVEEFLKEAGYA